MIKLPNFKNVLSVGKTFVMVHRPELLFGASVTATLAAVGLAAKGGYEARGIIDEAQEKSDEPLTRKEQAQLTWLCYLPAATATVGAVGATTGLHIVHMREKKALATAALAAIEEVRTSAKEFERENLKILEDPDNPDNVKVEYGDGEIEEMYLVRDGKTGRDIWSNERRIKEALLRVHEQLTAGESVELAMFYAHAGFAETEDSYSCGWGGKDWPELRWANSVRDDGRPVREFSFRPAPKVGYNRD